MKSKRQPKNAFIFTDVIIQKTNINIIIKNQTLFEIYNITILDQRLAGDIAWSKSMARRVFPTERRGGPQEGLHFHSQARLIEYLENYAHKCKESSLEVSKSSLT
jgi:hypothetical protein